MRKESWKCVCPSQPFLQKLKNDMGIVNVMICKNNFKNHIEIENFHISGMKLDGIP